MTSLGPPELAQDRSAVLRVLVERRVDLVVEVVEERHAAPQFLVLPELVGVRPDAGLDCQGVPEQRLARRVLGQRLPGVLAGDLHASG